MIVYIKKKKGKIVLIILVYVNNIAVVTLENIHIISFKMALYNNFNITNLRELKFMLEILVTCDYIN